MLIGSFRRLTSDGRWVPEIDGLRFIAITSVVLFHTFRELLLRSGRVITVEPNCLWLSGLIGNGDRGVGLFFVISGMILALPFARYFLSDGKAVSLSKYYMRRLTRLEPPYVVAVLLTAALTAVYSHGVPSGFGRHLLATLLYQHNLAFGKMSSVNPVAWSLEVEIQFYIIAPFLMQYFRIKNRLWRRVLLLSVVLMLGVAQAPFQASPRFTLSILFYLQYFVMGLLAADIFVVDLPKLNSSWIWDATGIASLALLFGAPDIYLTHAVLPIFHGALCISAMRSLALRRFLSYQYVCLTGGMCYSIYLLHFTFIAVLFKLTRSLIFPHATFFANYAVQLLTLAFPASALCAIFFLLVERPCMDPLWLENVGNRLYRSLKASAQGWNVLGEKLRRPGRLRTARDSNASS